MEQFLKTLLQKYNLTEDELNKCMAVVTGGVLMALIANTKGLEEKDVKKVKENMEKAKFDDALAVIEVKYSPDEWSKYTEQQIFTVVDDYMKSVALV